jgi:hypothetical protein
VQPVPADHLGVRRALRSQAITLAVGVPAQLHVPHEPVLPRYGVVMLVSAGIIQAKVDRGRPGAACRRAGGREYCPRAWAAFLRYQKSAAGFGKI